MSVLDLRRNTETLTEMDTGHSLVNGWSSSESGKLPCPVSADSGPQRFWEDWWIVVYYHVILGNVVTPCG